MAGWTGTASYDTANTFGITTFTAEVDYAVFAPGDSPIGGVDPAHYVYAYQVVTVQNGMMGAGYVTRLSVNLDEDEVMGVIGSDPLLGGTVSPSNAAFAPASPPYDSAGWDFNPAIYAGSSSPVLYFTSLYGPEWDTAPVTGTMAAGDTQLMPAPIPEPLSLVLLISGAGVVLRRRR